LREGFGLTVTEAQWKETPVVASRVGGIPDQVITFLSGSERRVNGSFYLAMNFWWDSALSGEMPSTTAHSPLISFQKSRKPQASLVQPGVSSLG